MSKNGLAACNVRIWNVDMFVEAAGASEGSIERVRSVGGGDDNNAFGRGKSVHLGKKLIDRLATGVGVSRIALGADLKTTLRCPGTNGRTY